MTFKLKKDHLIWALVAAFILFSLVTNEPAQQSTSAQYDTSLTTVSNHVFTTGKLPPYYIKKSAAKSLGWNPSAGNLHAVAPNKAIGGDHFGNRENRLPNKSGRKWYEADLNYNGGFRGAERLVYSNDNLVYHTKNHYKSFNKVARP